MTDNYYTDNTAISKSGLDAIEVSPLDYWWKYVNPQREGYKEDKQTAFDKALRSAVFNPVEFANRYVRRPVVTSRTNVAKMEAAGLEKSANDRGQILISASDFDLIQEMKGALLNHKTIKLLIEGGEVGKDQRFTEDNSGAVVKFRPHYISKVGALLNLMSTEDASAANFSKEAWMFKHHKRAAIQMDGTGFVMAFIGIEKKTPYKIGIHHMDARSLSLGRDTYISNCRTYMECLSSGKWPGLPETINPVCLPEYAFKKYD